VPLLTDPNGQVRLAVYHGGVEVLPENLGANWRDEIRRWSDDARLDFIVQLSRNPWLADAVQEIALADPSPKIRWNVAHMFNWYDFTDRVEALLKTIDDVNLLEILRTARADGIPSSQWPRVVGIYEQAFKEAADPLERLRLLYLLQQFGGTKIEERMKAELDSLGPGQLKSNDHQKRVRWALDEVQKSDPKWVSEWATRRVLEKSIWPGAWRGLITQISSEQENELFSRFNFAPRHLPALRFRL
jgi:hypothetical protein